MGSGLGSGRSERGFCKGKEYHYHISLGGKILPQRMVRVVLGLSQGLCMEPRFGPKPYRSMGDRTTLGLKAYVPWKLKPGFINIRTSSTTTRDRNLQFRGAVSTGGSPLDFLLFFQYLCVIW